MNHFQILYNPKINFNLMENLVLEEAYLAQVDLFIKKLVNYTTVKQIYYSNSMIIRYKILILIAS
jgi:hypothetical protein